MQGKEKASSSVVGVSDYASLQKSEFCTDGQEVYEILSSSFGYEISENNRSI